MTSKLKPMERLVWTDIETTGLDPAKEVILEVGFKITDLTLHVVDNFSVCIWNEAFYANKVREANDLVKDMHDKSGLFEDASMNGVEPDEAEAMILHWLDKNEIGREDPMCGSSVQFDRGFLAEQMPDVANTFSYRNIDMSSVKELCRRFNPILYSKLDEDTNPQKAHRVSPDIDDTINEAEFYLDNFLWVP